MLAFNESPVCSSGTCIRSGKIYTPWNAIMKLIDQHLAELENEAC